VWFCGKEGKERVRACVPNGRVRTEVLVNISPEMAGQRGRLSWGEREGGPVKLVLDIKAVTD